ncbi:hypothetical protein HDK77DRAFT_58523 [Phyllosticta capitalensis]
MEAQSSPNSHLFPEQSPRMVLITTDPPLQTALRRSNNKLAGGLRVECQAVGTKMQAGRTEGASRFLDLPRELRDQIYEHVLDFETLLVRAVKVSTEAMSPHRSTFRLWRAEWTYRLGGRLGVDFHQQPDFNILKVSRQVYFESAAVLYSKNVFFDHGFGDCRLSPIIQLALAFFKDRSALALESIKSVRFKIRGWKSFLSGSREDSEEAVCGNVKHQAALDFISIFRDRLPALNHISIFFMGWPPKHGVADHWRRELAEYAGSGDDNADDKPPTLLNILLHLPRVERFSMELWADIWIEEQEDHGRLVAFTAAVRSRLLRSAKSLGTSNVSVHRRHQTEFVNFDTGHSIIRRRSDRRFVVRCDDNADGRSLLTPAQRPEPLCTGPPGYWDTFSEYPKSLDDARSSFFDYAYSDGGDNDSLHELDLSNLDLAHTEPDFFALASLE